MTTAVKERPILFSGEMVRQILAGKKTQTRRLVKPQPEIDTTGIGIGYSTVSLSTTFWPRKKEYPTGQDWRDGYSLCDANGNEVYEDADGHPFVYVETGPELKCPYGKPGDRLWVRETWSDANTSAGPGIAYKADNHFWQPDYDGEDFGGGPSYNYDKYPGEYVWWYEDLISGVEGKWRPSIHMPRWASRITLEVTEVRVQRLWDISEQDALAEGFDKHTCHHYLSAACDKLESSEAYYVENDEGDLHDGYLCEPCSEKLQSLNPGSTITWGCCPESDGPAWCDECNRPLILSLTAYGIDSKLFLDDTTNNAKHYAASGLDAASASLIAGGIGDLRDRHLGRLAQIGFATAWDSINGKKHPWESNPWVWAITFQRVEP